MRNLFFLSLFALVLFATGASADELLDINQTIKAYNDKNKILDQNGTNGTNGANGANAEKKEVESVVVLDENKSIKDYPGFLACSKKNQKYFITIGSESAFAYESDKAILFSPKVPPKEYLKYDPYLKLYLVSIPKIDEYELQKSSSLDPENFIGSTTKDGYTNGVFIRGQNGLGDFSKASFNSQKSSMIITACCKVYGVGAGGENFYENRYLEKFVNEKDVFWGDLGVELEERNGAVFVKYTDPFGEKTKFITGDEIISIDGEKIKTLKGLNDKILFSKKDQKFKVIVKRNSKTYTLEIESKNRQNLKFLEHLGIKIDSDGTIASVMEGSRGLKKGLKKGDKIVWIDKIEASTPSKIKEALAKSSLNSKNIEFLISRNNFQFFVNFEK